MTGRKVTARQFDTVQVAKSGLACLAPRVETPNPARALTCPWLVDRGTLDECLLSRHLPTQPGPLRMHSHLPLSSPARVSFLIAHSALFPKGADGAYRDREAYTSQHSALIVFRSFMTGDW